MKKVSAKKASKKKKIKTPKFSGKKLVRTKPIGVITHYYTEIKVGIFKFKKPISTGAKIHIKGATTDFSDTIKSMQFDHKEIKKAPKGKQIGIKLKKRVRVGDEVFEAD